MAIEIDQRTRRAIHKRAPRGQLFARAKPTAASIAGGASYARFDDERSVGSVLALMSGTAAELLFFGDHSETGIASDKDKVQTRSSRFVIAA